MICSNLQSYLLLGIFIIKKCVEGNISSPVRYSYLLILPYDKADIFAASLLTPYFSSALSSGKIDKYEYLTGEELLPSNQQQIIEQAKFT